MLTGSQIRGKFLEFFEKKNHRIIHSSSLVPQNDPTLLFTNAGMNQFKDVFLGLEKRDYTRATSSQKCVRAGGKHNDLENVGFTNRHHTFFEMLGNFSFGDYFKKEAIAYAWELLTSPEWFNIPKEKMYVTIFKGENGVERDSEAYDLWLGQGIPKDRIYEFGTKDNFWQMGDTGPCGPCSEIHYDMGPAASDQGHTDCAFGCDCGRYVEIWNLVFMQYERACENKDPHQHSKDCRYALIHLPKPSIDTGMGLERVASVLQGVISNYDTDLFVPLMQRAAGWTGVSLMEIGTKAVTGGAASLRVIADHARARTFLISDGVLPSNEGRGYVLKKIIRRAIRHGRLLGQTRPFLHKMVDAVCDVMADAYPELNETRDRVSKILLTEEVRFGRTLELGLKKLEDLLASIHEQHSADVFKYLAEIDKASQGKIFQILQRKRQEAIATGQSQEAALNDLVRGVLGPNISGDVLRGFTAKLLSFPRLDGQEAFKLYDTYGLPVDFIQESARDMDVSFDQEGFDKALEEQRNRARSSWKGIQKRVANPDYQSLPASVFDGYSRTDASGCQVIALMHGGRGVMALRAGDQGEIILDHTPFYAESGGQVGDRGWFYSDDHNTVVAEVTGCYSPIQGVRAHQVTAKHPIRVGQKVDAVVNTDIRQSTMRNHTATHLLHAGLREVVGKHVKQAGSLVAPNHLRFDFSHFTGVEDEELQDIEDIINKEVLRNEKVEVIENVPIDVAVNEYHAMALFGEKYGDKVRVIKIGDFSTELCGGTHTLATGEIGLIKILKEGSVSSGVRRIEAVTGEGSLQHFRKDHELEGVVASLTSKEAASPADALRAELDRRDAEIKRLARELDQARMKSASSSAASATDNVREVRGVKVLAHRVDNLERPQLRTLVDQLRDKLGSGVVVVGSASNGNV